MSIMKIDDIEIREADIFKILLDNFPDMIHSIGDDGKIVYTNKTAETLLGYTSEELIGKDIKEIYADRILREMEKGFSDLKEDGDKNIPESWLKTKDGEEIPVEIRSFSIYDDKGNFLRTFSILRDLRTVKDLQNSLAHAGRLAAIGELASGVAHDINNPLTVIMLSNEIMQKELESDMAHDEMVEGIKSQTVSVKKASQSIEKLANHLRNFSRGVEEKHEKVDLAHCIDDALFMTDNKMIKADVQLQNNIEKERYYVDGAPNKLEQIFMNLISNACDAMEDAETRNIAIDISSCERTAGKYWKVDVSDTGAGIPENILGEIFQSFMTTKKKDKGTGLGLSISRGIASEHKGDIQVKSTLGEGTTFSVFLLKATT